MRGRFGTIIFFLYLVWGLYLLNLSLSFVKMPKFMESIESWIFLIAGILLLIGGVISLAMNRRRYY